MAKRRQNGEGTIYQRSDGLWVCDITLGFDENNKRIRKTLSSKNLETLKKKINETKYLKDRDMIAAPNDITVEEWMEFWLETYKKPFVKPTTYDTYYSAVYNYIVPRFGATKLTAISPAEIQQFINSLSKSGKKAPNGLSPSSVRKVYITLQQGYEQAITQGLLYKNPCKGIKTPKQEKSPAVAFTLDEQNKFLNACNNTSTYNNLFIFGFNTGLRLGEMLGLTWDDINWNDKTIQINKSIVQTTNHDKDAEKKIQTIISTPKTENSKRIVPLTKQAINALECQKIISTSVFVFPSAVGTPLTKRNVLRSFGSILKKAEITSPVTPHSMRHSFATRLLEKGADIKTISELLGHKSIQITLDIYSHISVDRKRNAIDLLN